MCIVLKLYYAKFDVSGLFCSKVIKEKPLGGWLYPSIGKGRVNDPIRDFLNKTLLRKKTQKFQFLVKPGSINKKYEES